MDRRNEKLRVFLLDLFEAAKIWGRKPFPEKQGRFHLRLVALKTKKNKRSINPRLPNTWWGGLWTSKSHPKDQPEQVFWKTRETFPGFFSEASWGSIASVPKTYKTHTFGSREHVVHGSTWESPLQLQAFTHVRHRNLTRSEIKPSTPPWN